MKISIYNATVAHDQGKSKLKVVSLSGREAAIKIIMAMEHCPQSAIEKITEIKNRGAAGQGAHKIMKTLNQHSTKIFCALLDRLNGAAHLEIENKLFMPLTIEKVGENVDTYWGNSSQYSLCHYYLESGDLVQDPEMCFIVADRRQEDTAAWEKVKIVPYLYRKASLGIYEESITFRDHVMDKYDRNLQLHHVVFANQGFLSKGIK